MIRQLLSSVIRNWAAGVGFFAGDDTHPEWPAGVSGTPCPQWTSVRWVGVEGVEFGRSADSGLFGLSLPELWACCPGDGVEGYVVGAADASAATNRRSLPRLLQTCPPRPEMTHGRVGSRIERVFTALSRRVCGSAYDSQHIEEGDTQCNVSRSSSVRSFLAFDRTLRSDAAEGLLRPIHRPPRTPPWSRSYDVRVGVDVLCPAQLARHYKITAEPPKRMVFAFISFGLQGPIIDANFGAGPRGSLSALSLSGFVYKFAGRSARRTPLK